MANVNELCSQWLEEYLTARPQMEAPKKGIFGYEMPVWMSAVIQKLLGEQLELINEHEQTQDALDDLSKRFTALIQQNSALAADNERLTEELQKQKEMTIACADELIQAASELSGIKKQEPIGHIQSKDMSKLKDGWITPLSGYAGSHMMYNPSHYSPVYAKPVHQHSFTLSGIGTFYADSELEIKYLERLHGVGGKANLKAVDDINHRANEFGKRFSDAAPVCLSCGRYKQDLNRIDEMHRNIHEVKRAGDQTVTVTFSSCRTASVFEKHINEEKERAK